MIIILMCSGSCTGEDRMKIYFIPFNVQTYVPVTMNNIEEKAFHVFEITNNSKLAIKLIRMLDQDNYGILDDKMIRLKLQNRDKIYYVDSKGNIKVSTKISKCDTEDVEKVINEMIAKYKQTPK